LDNQWVLVHLNSVHTAVRVILLLNQTGNVIFRPISTWSSNVG